MCQVHTGAYVSLLAPRKNDYTACHPRKTTSYVSHEAFITTHTHDRSTSQLQKKNKKKKKRQRKGKKREESEKKNKTERKENT